MTEKPITTVASHNYTQSPPGVGGDWVGMSTILGRRRVPDDSARQADKL